MEPILTALRIVHVAAGFAALVVAPIAMATAKGGSAHRRWGKLYYRAMIVIASTAVILGVARPNLFLTMIAVFSFYAAFSGYRVLARKRPGVRRAAALDWVMASLTLGASMTLVVFGLVPPSPGWLALSRVAVALGAVGILLAARDLVAFVRPPADRHAWWFSHMSGMLGSYIAVVTAFSVVNFSFMPLTARWLWPSWIGTPLIVLWIAYYRRRFRAGPPAAVKPANLPTETELVTR